MNMRKCWYFRIDNNLFQLDNVSRRDSEQRSMTFGDSLSYRLVVSSGLSKEGTATF